MVDYEEEVFATPEEAARGDIPEQYATVLGVRVQQHRAIVWMLTNDRPTFEAYTVVCHREGDGWVSDMGSNSFGYDPPQEVEEAAARLGWR
jgi:hypothetical protein